MLTIYQSEKVAIALKLIKEVQEQVQGTDINKAILLGDAADACNEVLQEDLPEGFTLTCTERSLSSVLEEYVPPVSPERSRRAKEEAWYSPDSISSSLPAPTVSRLVSDFIKGMFIEALKTSVVCAGLSACLSLGYWGTSEIFNTNLRIESELKSQSRSCLGASAIFSSVAAGSIVLAALVAREGE